MLQHHRVVFILRVLGNQAHHMYFGYPFGDKGNHFTSFLYSPDLRKAINQVLSLLIFCFLHMILKFCASCVNQQLPKWFSKEDPLEPHLLSLSFSFLSTSFLLPITNLPLCIYKKRVWNKVIQIWVSWRRLSLYSQCMPSGLHWNFFLRKTWINMYVCR